MSSLSELEDSILSIVVDVLGAPREKVGVNTDLRALGIESFQVLRAVARIEERFDVEVPDDAVFHMASVSEMAKTVAELLASERAAAVS